LSNVSVTDIVICDGEVVGAVGIDVPTSKPVKIKCAAVILCTGGMTKMFERTTSSNNLAGEGVGLALRSGARIIDIEFLQFYPNGHLAPRMVGLDPTTWEPTRVKLGGRLLDGNGEIIAIDRGDNDMGEAELGGCLRNAPRFMGIERTWKTSLDVAEGTGARASVAHDHERGVFLFPAFANVRTASLLAHGVQRVFAHKLLRGEVTRRDRSFDANPIWLR
jgi:succinate dehydrogenase/fumarate reductase flavoprotein subunit